MPKSEEEITKIREAALKNLAEHKDDLDKFEAKIEGQEERWQKELALLERRVETNIVEISLGDKKKGETITIRASLSDYENGEISRLYDIRNKLDKEKDLEAINEISYIVLATVTANPWMTKKWFKDNRTKYSTEDMLSVILSYFELMSKRAKRVAEIQQFR